MFSRGDLGKEKCVLHIKRVPFFKRACIKLFYIILDNFSLIQAPAKAYFSPFISLFYRSILLTSIFLSPFAKYTRFFIHSHSPLLSIFPFCQLSFTVFTHTVFLFLISIVSSLLSAFMYLYILHCRHDIVQVKHTIWNKPDLWRA